MYCYGEIRTTADKIGGNGKLRRVYIFDFFSAKLAFLLQMWNECGSCEGLLAREERKGMRRLVGTLEKLVLFI